MNTDQLIDRYWRAIVATTQKTQDMINDDAILLALNLAVTEAYDAGAALCNDMAAIIASQTQQTQQTQQTPDQRQAEVDRAQISTLNEWLADEEPALYHDPYTDTAQAMIAAIRKRDEELWRLIQEADSTERQLKDQLIELDADNADLTARLQQAQQGWATAQADADRLALRIAQQPDAIHVNGNGTVDPTPAPNWNRNHWAWDGLPKADFDVIDQLEAGVLSFRKLDKTLRRDLVLRVVRSLAVDGELKVAVYDSRKPAWMPTNGAVTMFSPNGRWPGLVAEALGKAEPTPA